MPPDICALCVYTDTQMKQEVHSVMIWGLVMQPVACPIIDLRGYSRGTSVAVTNAAAMPHFMPFSYPPACNDNEKGAA